MVRLFRRMTSYIYYLDSHVFNFDVLERLTNKLLLDWNVWLDRTCRVRIIIMLAELRRRRKYEHDSNSVKLWIMQSCVYVFSCKCLLQMMCEFFDIEKNARMYHTFLDELQQTFPCHAEGSQVSTNHQMQRNKSVIGRKQTHCTSVVNTCIITLPSSSIAVSLLISFSTCFGGKQQIQFFDL